MLEIALKYLDFTPDVLQLPQDNRSLQCDPGVGGSLPDLATALGGINHLHNKRLGGFQIAGFLEVSKRLYAGAKFHPVNDFGVGRRPYSLQSR